MQRVKLWVMVLGALVVAACLSYWVTATPGSAAEVYLGRLQNVLGEWPQLAAEPLVRFPRRRELQRPLAAQQIDLIDYAKLHLCDLGELASLRQGPLGQVMPASQQLLLDLRWLREGQPCVDAGATWLQPLLDHKRAQLPKLYWNAVVAGPEFADLMSLAQTANRSAPDAAPDVTSLPILAGHLRQLLDAYKQLQGFIADVEPETSWVGLEATLAGLRLNPTLGQLRKSWQERRMALATARSLLLDAGPRVCRNQKPTPAARNAHRVFEQYYRDGLQPVMALEYAGEQQVVELLTTLHTELMEIAPPVFNLWFAQVFGPADGSVYAQRASEWQQAQQATRDHAAAWQQFWKACGMQPLGRS